MKNKDRTVFETGLTNQSNVQNAVRKSVVLVVERFDGMPTPSQMKALLQTINKVKDSNQSVIVVEDICNQR